MNTYGVGASVFCDFHFGGKPKGKIVKVIEPGNGKDKQGKVLVKLTETVGAYKKDEELELSTFQAVPNKEVLPRRDGQFFTRVSTLYQYQ